MENRLQIRRSDSSPRFNDLSGSIYLEGEGAMAKVPKALRTGDTVESEHVLNRFEFGSYFAPGVRAQHQAGPYRFAFDASRYYSKASR